MISEIIAYLELLLVVNTSYCHDNQDDKNDKKNLYKPLTNKTIRMAVDKFCSLYHKDVKEVIETYGHISNWNTSEVTNMSRLFYNKSDFNEDISRWDVSNVSNMDLMFSGASIFNGDLSKWDVSNVTDMSNMFSYADCFNSDISNWNVSKVVNMRNMFHEAKTFNFDLNRWNVSNVVDMNSMFSFALSFNGNVCDWKINENARMERMFWCAEAFKQNLSNWDIKNKNTRGMFSFGCGLKPDDIKKWSNPDFYNHISYLCNESSNVYTEWLRKKNQTK